MGQLGPVPSTGVLERARRAFAGCWLPAAGYAAVRVDPQTGTVVWPGGADLAPDPKPRPPQEHDQCAQPDAVGAGPGGAHHRDDLLHPSVGRLGSAGPCFAADDRRDSRALRPDAGPWRVRVPGRRRGCRRWRRGCAGARAHVGHRGAVECSPCSSNAVAGLVGFELRPVVGCFGGRARLWEGASDSEAGTAGLGYQDCRAAPLHAFPGRHR
jgi:hypothetical protein